MRSKITIRNISVLVNAVAYFTSNYMGLSLKLKIMAQKIFILSKRFFGTLSFFNNAMADGIFEPLKKDTSGPNFTYQGKTGLSAAVTS
jgi:hypothetical protein